MSEVLRFETRAEFREWLSANCLCHEGVWILFDKSKQSATLSAEEALEEALCFGWIDGQIQSIDANTYKKYFCMRRTKSNWSAKNKALTKSLEKRGLMTDFGRQKIEEAKQNGQWDAPKQSAITDEQINLLCDVLKAYQPAYKNFQAMSPSIKKTYVKAYLDAKTEAGRKNRIAWIVDRLNKNLKPM